MDHPENWSVKILSVRSNTYRESPPTAIAITLVGGSRVTAANYIRRGRRELFL